MANDSDWVQDVRRWYFGGHPPEGETGDGDGGEDVAVGYEAAQPQSQGARWPDGLTACER